MKAETTITLYKFVTVKSASAILTNQTLRFTPLHEYNDPFEGENSYEFELNSSSKVVLIGKTGSYKTLRHQPDMEALEDARKLIADHAACCFCQRNDSILLWSHYADEHRGICLAFEFETNGLRTANFEDIEDREYLLFREVNYSKHRPQLLMNTDTSSVVPYEVIDASVFTKSLDWSYEQEWRFAKRNSPALCYHKFRDYRLKQVIFGMRCSEKDVESISRLVTSKYQAQLARAQKHQFLYAVEIIPEGGSGESP